MHLVQFPGRSHSGDYCWRVQKSGEPVKAGSLSPSSLVKLKLQKPQGSHDVEQVQKNNPGDLP